MGSEEDSGYVIPVHDDATPVQSGGPIRELHEYLMSSSQALLQTPPPSGGFC